MILRACHADDEEKKIRTTKEGHVEAMLAASEAASAARRDAAEKRATRGDVRSIRRRARAEHAANRAAIVEKHLVRMRAIEAWQRRRLHVEARRASQQEQPSARVQVMMNAQSVVGLRAIAVRAPRDPARTSPRRSREHRSSASPRRSSREGSPRRSGAPQVTLSLHITRPPAQRLFAFDRTDDDRGRQELRMACDAAERVIAAAREEIYSAEAEQQVQRAEVRAAAAERASASARRAADRAETAARLAALGPEGEDGANGGGSAGILGWSRRLLSSGPSPSRLVLPPGGAGASAAQGSVDVPSVVVPCDADSDPFVLRARSRRAALRAAVADEEVGEAAEMAAEVRELAALAFEADAMREVATRLHAMGVSVQVCRAALLKEAASPHHLPIISPTSPQHLPTISPSSPHHLPIISPPRSEGRLQGDLTCISRPSHAASHLR